MDVHQITSGQRAGLTVRGGANVELPCSRAQRHQSNLLSLSQALPYVALLIAMIFFIYAVIGMQVSSHTGDAADPIHDQNPSVLTQSVETISPEQDGWTKMFLKRKMCHSVALEPEGCDVLAAERPARVLP